MDSKEIDKLAGANAKAPRVSLKDIEDQILGVFYQTGDHLLGNADIKVDSYKDTDIFDRAKIMTVCTIMLKNGWMVIGQSTPASPENFNPELGKTLAYDQAFKQLWPLMGFALKQQLYENQQFIMEMREGSGD